jgi:hypothetical protein
VSDEARPGSLQAVPEPREGQDQHKNPDRRENQDRRKSTFRAFIHGGLSPRRRGPRRAGEIRATDVDLHHPQWLGVTLLVLLLSCADALLTLTLISHGAVEINPLMAKLVYGSGHGFAAWKIGVTAVSLIVLAVLARVRVRLFGYLPVGAVLYLVLAGYVILVCYEVWLLDRIASAS